MRLIGARLAKGYNGIREHIGALDRGQPGLPEVVRGKG